MMTVNSDRAAEAVRRFNHFYSRYTRGLQECLRQSAFSMAEVRVLQALVYDPPQTAAQIARSLGLDTGYLSRLLTRFERNGLLVRLPSIDDARKHVLILTKAGRTAFDEIGAGSIVEVSATLDRLAEGERAQLMSSMADIERLLSPPVNQERVRLRSPRRGDFGWIVERCAQLASRDNAGPDMETRAASVVTRFLDSPSHATQDARPSACWIAEQDHGSRIGAAILMRVSERLARIELLFVEPGARRQGLGSRLVDACSRFAVDAGCEQLSCSFDEAHADLRGFVVSRGFAAANEGWQRSLSSIDA
ncbi:TDP-fucosamine acetyltransferase [Caballeronia telluris]|uniref:TDP-fucosamine acetyltransferase n=2 Tax=Caballeronia telluris TaxID=326475 RepID=A0A158FQF1_9BURK|nr:TDP-fucosamine acetyltransferase [Caballeronia telluris]